MEVRELIGGPVETCTPRERIDGVARRMTDTGVGSMVVMDDGRVVGIVTERDLLGALADALKPSTTVDEIMTGEPDVASPDDDVKEAVNWMLATGCRHLPVVEDQELVGMVSVKDVLWAITGP